MWLVEICRICFIFVCVSAVVSICVCLLKGLVRRLEKLAELNVNNYNVLLCISYLNCYVTL
jgi:hypothetical protein